MDLTLLGFILHEETLLINTIKLFDLFLFMLPLWLKVDYGNLNKSKGELNMISKNLPLFMFEVIYSFHSMNIENVKDYVDMLPDGHINEIINLIGYLGSE